MGSPSDWSWAHPLTYAWSAACPGPDDGAFDNAQTRTPIWTAPFTGGTPLSCTLTVAITDPTVPEIQTTLLACDLLMGRDEYAMRWIKAFRKRETEAQAQ